MKKGLCTQQKIELSSVGYHLCSLLHIAIYDAELKIFMGKIGRMTEENECTIDILDKREKEVLRKIFKET